MKTVINNENKKVQVSPATFEALKAMCLDEFALIKDINGNPHMIIISDNFWPMLNETAKKFLRVEAFLKEYCPELTNVPHKLRGVDGNKRPIDFSNDEKKLIKSAIKKFAKDICL